MTTYTIEEGIPVPPRADRPGAPRSANTPLTQALDALAPGQSVLMTQAAEFKAAKQFKTRRPERKFAIRKVPREGWRVWRTE